MAYLVLISGKSSSMPISTADITLSGSSTMSNIYCWYLVVHQLNFAALYLGLLLIPVVYQCPISTADIGYFISAPYQGLLLISGIHHCPISAAHIKHFFFSMMLHIHCWYQVVHQCPYLLLISDYHFINSQYLLLISGSLSIPIYLLSISVSLSMSHI